MDTPSSSSSSSTFMAGGRALDRHNPIITDEKRSGVGSNPGTPIGTPRTHHVLQQKPKTPISTPPNPKNPKNKKTNSTRNTTKNTISKLSPLNKNNKNIIINDNDNDKDNEGDEITMKAAVRTEICKPNVGYNNVVSSQPESSRYLLDDDEDDDDSSFLDVFSGFDPYLKLDDPVLNLDDDPGNDTKGLNKDVEVEVEVEDLSSKAQKKSSSPSSDQVVVLRVSLHCRGCERKMKKHLSRMSGVTSFNIDFAAKKVTVVGDVTPLQVLASISKVKTAKLWSPPIVEPQIKLNN